MYHHEVYTQPLAYKSSVINCRFSAKQTVSYLILACDCHHKSTCDSTSGYVVYFNCKPTTIYSHYSNRTNRTCGKEENEIETGNGNWKQNWEQTMYQSLMQSFLHGLISSVFCHYSSGYVTGFMSHVLYLKSCSVHCRYLFNVID